jgi:allantoin racemase
MKTIAFINATSGFTDEERERRRQVYQSHLPEGMQAVVLSMPTGPAFFDRSEQFGEAIGGIADFLSGLDLTGVDVVVWSGAIDPGLAIARATLDLPVVGPGESAMYLASVVGQPLSIVTVDEHAVAAMPGFLDACPAKPPIASVRGMGVPVRRIVSDRAAGAEALQREARLAVREDGARALYFGSMTLGTLGVADGLRTELGVPIFDPMRVAAGVAARIAESQPA